MATLTTLKNLISQALDISGSLSQDDGLPFSEENAYLGEATGGSGAAASIIAGAAAGRMRVDGVSGMAASHLGNFLTISAATSPGNNGTFPIVNVVDADTVDVLNADAVIPDANNGNIEWVEREPYTLLTDLNYARSDRSAIKGVNYHAAIPTYERPTAVGTDVPANLSNIAGKTLDAQAEIIEHKFENQAVAAGDTFKLLSDAGNMKHADAVDRTGIPIYDGADAGDVAACFCEMVPQGQLDALTAIGKAVGQLNVVQASLLVVGADTDTFVLDDGTNPAVTFIYDDDDSVTETATTRAIDHTGTETADQIRDLTIAAVNAAPALNILAESGGAGIVKLTNEVPGVAGNVAIVETVGDAGFTVSGMAGGTAYAGYRVYGVMYDGTGTSPNSAEAKFYCVAPGDPMSVANVYTWERDQPVSIDFYVPFRKRMDQITENERRTTLVHGIVGDAGLTQRVDNLQDVIDEGLSDAMLHIGSLLTNKGNYYIWSDLPDATPSVVEALNTINAQIGNRDYTGPYLTDGQTITASLQALSDAVASASVVRYIEKLVAAELPGADHTLPGAASYTLDGTGNGRYLWVATRGTLRHPGTDPADYDYTEKDVNTITWLRAQSAGTIIDFFVL